MSYFHQDVLIFCEHVKGSEKLLELSSKLDESNLKNLLHQSSLIKLSTGIEVFVESLAESFGDLLRNQDVPNRVVPDSIKLYCLKHNIGNNEKLMSKIKHRKNEALSEFLTIYSSLHPDEIFRAEINSEFSFGKHGTDEINDIFCRIGIENIFEATVVYEDSESLINNQVKIDFKSLVNQLTNYRNKIIHEGDFANITYEKVKEMISQSLKMIYKIEEIANFHFKKIIEAKDFVALST